MAKKQASEKPKPIPIRITALAQLETRPIIVTLERYGGDEPELIEIHMRTLTYGEWEAIGRQVPNPMPQVFGGREGNSYDTKNPAYVRDVNEADRKRLLYRLAASVILDDLNGDDLEAKSQALLKLDMQIIESLLFVLMQAHQGRMAQVTARAESFHANGQSDTPNPESVGDHLQPVS